MLTDALRLARMGFALLWLRRPAQGGKEPIKKEWQSQPWTSPALLQSTYESGLNVGIRTGWVRGALLCVVVLDLDSPEALAWARANLPSTPVRVESRRGEHWYYLHPGPGIHVGNRVKVGKLAIDVRADGGQVVAPPSVHRSGHRYVWMGGLPNSGHLDALPTWDVSWFPSAPPTPAPPPASPSSPMSRNYRRGRGLARSWRVAEENEGRGTQTYKLALSLVRGLALDPESAYQLLATEFNPRLPQPYSELLLRRKISEALKANQATGAVLIRDGGP